MKKDKQKTYKAALTAAKRGDWEKANKILDGFGVEFVGVADRSLKYINLGDTYTTTICAEETDDGDNESPFIGSWGDWVEATEQEHCEENDEIRCGYCGEFTDNDDEDWHNITCRSCGHKVDGSK